MKPAIPLLIAALADPWMYGIACELVTGNLAIDRIPPYNLLHYGGAVPYFLKK